MLKYSIALITCFSATVAQAGPTELTALSRANCTVAALASGINESVTWDGSALIDTDEWEMKTISTRADGIETFEIESEAEYGWRSYAGCFYCGFWGWTVTGEHYVTANIDGNFDSDRDDWLIEPAKTQESIYLRQV